MQNKKGDKGKLLARYRNEVHDPYEPQYYTAITVSVYAPTIAKPYTSVLVSFANAGGRVLCRFKDMAALRKIFEFSPEDNQRLGAAVRQGELLADVIDRDWHLIQERRKLPQGTSVVRSDTGEVIAEAEKIIREAQS